MSYVKWTLILAVIATIVAFFHYALPQRDVVRIVDTDVTRVDVAGADPANPQTRDVRFIYAKYPDGGEMEFRNEDTGWGFPWYLKFDSANLANRATDFKSTRDAPRWVVVRHYGWRVPVLDMFPNAISIREADGPDEQLVPWFNIVFLSTLAVGLLMLFRIVIILRRRHIDPVVERIDAEIGQTGRWWRRMWRRLFGG